MGKSTSAEFLRACGVAVVDTDVLAREIVEPGGPALAEITALFGGGVIDASGALRRDRLAELVFADAAKRWQIEAILHPRIRYLWQQQIETWRLEKRPIAVVVIPLLYETDAAASFDRVICVACSARSQRGRLLARGWSPEQIDRRNQAQWSVEKDGAGSPRHLDRGGTGSSRRAARPDSRRSLATLLAAVLAVQCGHSRQDQDQRAHHRARDVERNSRQEPAEQPLRRGGQEAVPASELLHHEDARRRQQERQRPRHHPAQLCRDGFRRKKQIVEKRISAPLTGWSQTHDFWAALRR